MLFYGLVGKSLSHSFSKQIHDMLGNYFYDYFSVSDTGFEKLLNAKEFGGLNITIPYKQRVLPMCDHLSDNAKWIGAVNTVVNKDGELYGYNTDYLGFEYALKANNFDFKDKKVLILGSGGTSKTVEVYAKNNKAREVVKISRGGKDNYENISKHYDSNFIINTTPVGMYPKNMESLICLSCFKNCEGVFDVIYNPLKTSLLLEAEQLGIPCSNGLLMLVAQAKYSSELFFDKKISDEKIMDIYNKLYRDLVNIILIGMPSCGKTTVGKQIASSLGRKFIDTDKLVENEAGMPIPEIFEKYGENEFRQLEEMAIQSVGTRNGLVIATGGGSIINKTNCKHLKQNGKFILIDRDLNKLTTDGRPLSKNFEAIRALYKTRMPIYEKNADFVVHNNTTPEVCAKNIENILKGV